MHTKFIHCLYFYFLTMKIARTLFVFICLLFAGITYASDSLQSQTDTDSIVSKTIEKQLAQCAPVAPFGDTLFTIYGNVGTIRVEQRAEFISKNIKKLRKTPFFNPDSLLVVGDEVECDVIYGDEIIFGVTAPQAHAAGKTKVELATEYRDIVAKAIVKEQKIHKLSDFLKELGLAILVLVITFFVIKYLNFFYRKLRRYLEYHTGSSKEVVNTIVNRKTQVRIVIGFANTVRFCLVLIILYLAVLGISHVFPTTRGFSEMLLGYVLTPLKSAAIATWLYMPNLFEIVIIVLIFRTLIKTIRSLAKKIDEGGIKIGGFHPDWAMPTYQLLKIIFIIFSLIFIFPLLPSSHTDIFKGVSVFVGILFSLGSSSVVSNVVSGLVITYMRPFKVGDRIKMGEHVGDVIEKTGLVTRIKTAKNEVVTIPNSSLMTAQTINYSSSAKEHGLIVHSSITLGHSAPWRKVHELLMEAALDIPLVLKDPKPFVLQTALDNIKVQYEINAYIDDASQMAFVCSELHENIRDVFEREGIEISAK